MLNKIVMICQKEVELNGKKYIVYLKEVPSILGPSGKVLNTSIKAFVRQKNDENKKN